MARSETRCTELLRTRLGAQDREVRSRASVRQHPRAEGGRRLDTGGGVVREAFLKAERSKADLEGGEEGRRTGGMS